MSKSKLKLNILSAGSFEQKVNVSEKFSFRNGIVTVFIQKHERIIDCTLAHLPSVSSVVASHKLFKFISVEISVAIQIYSVP